MWPFTKKQQEPKPRFNILERKKADGKIYYTVRLNKPFGELTTYEMSIRCILLGKEYANISQACTAIRDAEIEAGNLCYSRVVREI